jgi:hypothetical protein
MEHNMENVEGFYTLYLTSAAGNGLGMIALNKGIISGADVAGALFDGSYEWDSTNNILKNQIKVIIPPNSQLLQGGTTGQEGLTYNVNFSVSFAQKDIPYFRIDTPTGAVNVKMVKIRNAS